MTLTQVIEKIERAASLQPSVHHIVRNDVFRLNEIPDAQYGTFAWTQQQHALAGDLLEFSFAFFFIDRLTADASNEIECQSVGIQTLTGIIRRLENDGILAGDVTFQTFNQKFADLCAGVWCNVPLQVSAEWICSDDNIDTEII